MPLAVIGGLPRNLSSLGRDELHDARHDRDERMTVLFRRWASLSKNELRELRKLSDERQRLARHVGNVRRLRALRTPVTSRTASSIEIACAATSAVAARL